MRGGYIRLCASVLRVFTVLQGLWSMENSISNISTVLDLKVSLTICNIQYMWFVDPK